MLRKTAGGAMTHRSGAIPEGVLHENGSPVTGGFRQLWPQLRGDCGRGADRESLLRRIGKAVENGTIADCEEDVIIGKLGL